MKQLPITLLFIFVLMVSQAQSPLTLGVSYWGEFAFHPGVKLSVDFQPLHREIPRVGIKKHKKKERFSLVSHALFTAPHIGYFVHPGNHQGLAIGGDVGYRLVAGKHKTEPAAASGFTLEVFANTDFFLQINSGATYSLDASGNVVPVAGLRPYFLVGTGIGLGYSFAKPKLAIMFRPNVSWQMPYDAIVLPRAFTELAVLFRL